ncbi:phage protein U [Sphingomonas kyeonggiensis]|uniref:phage tail protein n=1 Tax=Sphingomonas kyeonggiensis TaxID=1268553 RepID=UPI00277DF134|nr:phage tail protein [Sphingomonas kyeonggiensis]MDQ0250950.1 phage protein U [Sphingomonas kyeonggiensis]
MALAALGLFVFELATFPFSDFARDTEWAYARTPRVGDRDATQYVGPGAERISIGGLIAPEAVGSYGAIQTLRDMADQGESYDFIEGTGRILGRFLILRMSEQRKAMLVDGVPRVIDFSLELEREA